MFTVTVPVRSIPYQIVGSNRSLARPGGVAAMLELAYPSMTPPPIIAMRKPRREGSGVFLSPWVDKLIMCNRSSHSCRRKLDGFADSNVSHAAADIPRHYRVDVGIGRVGIVLDQRRCLHDLARLAVAALWRLQLEPRGLQRMSTLRIESFYRRDCGPGNCPDRGDARTCRAPFHVYRA